MTATILTVTVAVPSVPFQIHVMMFVWSSTDVVMACSVLPAIAVI